MPLPLVSSVCVTYRLEAMVQQLPSSGMTLTNKLRLIAIYIISQEGITEDVRRNLVALAGTPSHCLPSPLPSSNNHLPTCAQKWRRAIMP